MRVAAAKTEHEADPDQRSGAADDFHRDQREVSASRWVETLAASAWECR
jgi:hypothetical protein